MSTVAPEQPELAADPSTAATDVVACKTCGEVHEMEPLEPGQVAKCCRCGTTLLKRTHNSLCKTAAFALAALFLYVPAYTLPILHLELYGTGSDDTVFQGVQLFYRDRQFIMAGVVLLASMVIPAFKLLGLFFLVVTTGLSWTGFRVFRTRLFEVIDLIGRWAMLDVFALSIWVATVKLQRLGTITPGPGLFPFGCIVILTLLSANSFDPQTIWEGSRGTAS